MAITTLQQRDLADVIDC